MKQDLEQLMKDSFEHFEADVSPQVWTNIQAGLQAGPVQQGSGSGSESISTVAKTAGMISKFATALITVSVATVITAIGTWYYIKYQHTHLNHVPVAESPVSSATNGSSQPNTSAIQNQEPETNKRPSAITQASEPTVTENKLKADQPAASSNRETYKDESISIASLPKDQSESIIEKIPTGTNKNTEGSTESTEQHTNIDKQTISKLIESYQAQPLAYILANPVSGNAPLTVRFMNNGYAKASTWSVEGALVNDTKNEISYTFTNPGKYLVQLTASDENGTIYTDQIQIEVKGAQSLVESSVSEIQNVFTPNGDGYNDVFKLKGTNLSTVKGIIFNGLGQTVYQWNDLEIGWNGSLNKGGLAAEGAYYYIIEATGKDGKDYRFKGAVRLIK